MPKKPSNKLANKQTDPVEVIIKVWTALEMHGKDHEFESTHKIKKILT